MKNTIKVILVITLFLSATTISFAGEQGNGTKYCENCATSVIGSDLSGSTDDRGIVDQNLTLNEPTEQTKTSTENGIVFILENLFFQFWM